jgi:protein-L-isoaspartate O-methyltransferase
MCSDERWHLAQTIKLPGNKIHYQLHFGQTIVHEYKRRPFGRLFCTQKRLPYQSPLTLLEMLMPGNVMCFPDKDKPWMATRITRRERLTLNTRDFMRVSVLIVRNFVDTRLRNVVSWFVFF